MKMTTGNNNLGFYGKLPIKGDFVTRNLPRSFVDPWDQWLQESIATSRAQLKEQWLENYLTSPIWRFALSEGICADNAWVGLVMPSVDRVGRYFPLTLAAPVNNTYSLLSIADQQEDWFALLEQIALSALDQNTDFDAFIQEIGDLNLPKQLHVPSEPPDFELAKPKLDTSQTWRINMQESVSLCNNLCTFTQYFLTQRFPNLCIWWTHGSEKVAPSILMCNKLPPVSGFSALMTADWDQWGWDNIVIPHPLKADDKEITTDTTSIKLFTETTSAITETTPVSP